MKACIFCVVTTLACGGISGCNSEPPPATDVTAKPVVVAKATKENWDAALKASHGIEDLKSVGDGITEYRSVFSTDGKRSMVAFVTRDAFRKLRHWKTSGNSMQELSEGYASVVKKRRSLATLRLFIALPDYSLPIFFLAPKFLYKSGLPIGLSKVAILVGDDLVFEKKLDGSVRIDNDDEWRWEIAHLSLNDAEVDQLRKIKQDQNVFIRLTGKDKYVSVEADNMKDFFFDLRDALTIYDNLKVALKDNIPE